MCAWTIPTPSQMQVYTRCLVQLLMRLLRDDETTIAITIFRMSHRP